MAGAARTAVHIRLLRIMDGEGGPYNLECWRRNSFGKLYASFVLHEFILRR